MNLQLLHSEFPYISGKFDFLFYQCIFPHLNYYCQFFSKLLLCMKGVSVLRGLRYQKLVPRLSLPQYSLILIIHTSILGLNKI